MKVRKRVIIFGCGPAGLLAAHAAQRADVWFKVISIKRPSQLYGCQYLHSRIPGLSTYDSVHVSYQLIGTPGDYARKVYGPNGTDLKVSPSVMLGHHPAWDIRQSYRELWDKYYANIYDHEVRTEEVADIKEYFKADTVVSTIPAPLLCSRPGEHTFQSVRCWAIGDAPELGQYAPSIAAPFTVVCDATAGRGFYRASNVFGYNTVEWPGWKAKPPVSGIVPFDKPLRTDCDCHPGVVRMGRMGKWQKGVLSDDAFKEATELFAR